MARYYFINSQGTQIGPVERDDMLRFGITRDTLVWREGAPAWISAGQEPDLASYFATMPRRHLKRPPLRRQQLGRPQGPLHIPLRLRLL